MSARPRVRCNPAKAWSADFPLGFGSATANVQAPFLGAYFTASHNGFYFNALIRGDFYSATFNSPAAGLFDQNADAQGFSISASTGYNYTIPNSNWFVVPSAGVVYSRVSVDPINTAGPHWPFPLQGTFSTNDIVDTIGRIGVNVGTSFEFGGLNFQPFAGASVWHDFDQPYTANYTTCSGTMGHANGCAFNSLVRYSCKRLRRIHRLEFRNFRSSIRLASTSRFRIPDGWDSPAPISATGRISEVST